MTTQALNLSALTRDLRAAMSTDNSAYRIAPDVVAAPLDGADVVALLRGLEGWSDLAVTARGGGTGTNGQSLNHGLIWTCVAI